MGGVKHKDRAHALLSASGASRWINCTPSPRLEERFVEDSASSYAAEGTLAHEFGDIALRKAVKEITPTAYNKQAQKLRGNPLYTDDMEGEVEKYTNYVLEEFAEAKKRTKGAVLLIEERVDLTEFIEDGFGTCDADIIADGVMEVIDLKYGKGVRVDAVKNEQLMLYGLGALIANELSFDIHKVKLTIVQPRLDHISTWEISAEELTKWGSAIVIPKAKLAYSGEGLQRAGTWCRWCKAKARCATLAAQNVKVAQHEFKDPHLLTDEQLLQVNSQIAQIQDWAKAVAEYLLKEAKNGKKWAGLKLVEGRSNRRWSDEKKVIDRLDTSYDKDEYLNSKLKGIGDIEKLVGKQKFPALLGPLVFKPQGSPTLVPESDKRPAMGTDQAVEDFSK